MNEKRIVKALRDIGATVMHLSSPGMPDLLVGFRDVTYLLEVKTAKGTLTEPEQDFFKTWQGQCAIVRSEEEARRAIGAID
jgi:hypothetical protein